MHQTSKYANPHRPRDPSKVRLYAREKGVTPHERPGYVIPLSSFQKLEQPITLERIRALAPVLGALVSDLKRKYGEPLYFPFEISGKRPLRPLQGYAFKLPREIVALFPELSSLLQAASSAVQTRAKRNPAWSRDELILALDLYMRNRASPPGPSSSAVIELSDVLNQLGAVTALNADFRNPNGVYMKMLNFRRVDPEYTANGRVGLTRGNKLEELVWNDFAHDAARLAQVASAIRSAVQLREIVQSDEDEEPDFVEAPEGRVLTRLHRVRERNRKLVDQRKLKTLRENGVLQCEACQFNFEDRYGPRGRGFIETHHTKPLATLTERSVTKLEDLALVCANCHRMIHSQKPWLTIKELQAILRN